NSAMSSALRVSGPQWSIVKVFGPGFQTDARAVPGIAAAGVTAASAAARRAVAGSLRHPAFETGAWRTRSSHRAADCGCGMPAPDLLPAVGRSVQLRRFPELGPVDR